MRDRSDFRSPTPLLLPLLLLPLLLAGCGDSDPVDPDPEAQVAIEELVAGDPTLTLDPAGRAPLAALLTLETRSPSRVRVAVLGSEPLERPFGETAYEHEIPVLGLYAGAVNQVELRVEVPGSAFAMDTLQIETEPLPDFFPEIEIRTADRERMEPGWNFSALSIGTGTEFMPMPVIFDPEGDIRWYLDLSDFGAWVSPVEPARNGNILFGLSNSIYEYDLLGNEVASWEIPGWNFHHDVIEKPDGNLLAAVDLEGASTIHDHIIEVDRNSGEVVRVWDFREIMDIHRRDFVASAENWMHMNSLWYVEEEDALIVSSRNQSALVKVTGEGELVWLLGAHRGWGAAGPEGDGFDTSEFLLTAVDDEGEPYPEPVQSGEEGLPEFRWPWGQHTPTLLPNGNILVLDNGFNRNFTGEDLFSRGVEYEVDESAGTVRQVWQYGEERGVDFYAAIVSDVDHLPETGNRLVMPGVGFEGDSRAWVTEVTHPGGEEVFEAKIGFRNMLSAGIMEWGNFDMVYRSERIQLYRD